MKKFNLHILAILLIFGGAEISMAQTTWTGAVNDNWFTGANWDTGTVPDGVLFDVLIDSPSPTEVNGTPNINSLVVGSNGVVNARSFMFGGTANTTLSNAGIVNVGNTSTFQFSRTIVNSGEINLTDTNSSSSNLLVPFGTATLMGGGTLTMSGNAARITGEPGTSIVFLDQLIQGEGELGREILGITNSSDSLIDANFEGRDLIVESGDAGIINDGVMQASGGGILVLRNSDINNADGTIVAQTGSTVELTESTSVTGGLFAGPGSIDVATAFISDVTNTGTFNIGNADELFVTGTINNSGLINATDTSSSSARLIVASGEAVLTGGGTVTLSGNAARITGEPGTSIVFLDQTIQGEGDLGREVLGITNSSDSLIDANVEGRDLIVESGDTGIINDGVMQASGGGILELRNSDINNADGTIFAQADSMVQLRSGTRITGGLLSGIGSFDATGSSNVLDNVSNSSTINIGNNSSLGVTGTINNTGSINAIDTNTGNSNASVLSVQEGIATLTGGGTVTMSGNNARITGLSGTSIVFEDQLIQGEGDLGLDLIGFTNATGNLIDANVSGQTLTVRTEDAEVINDGVMQASGGGILRVRNSNIDNTNGSMVARVGSIVNLTASQNGESVEVTGGVLSGAGVFTVNTQSTLITDVTNSSTIQVGNNSRLSTSGTLTNSGTIILEDTVPNFCASILELGGPLKGGGTIKLIGNNARIEGASNSPINICDITIEGEGEFGDDTIEIDGGENTVFHANIDGSTLSIDLGTPTFVSSCILRASNGGILELVDEVTNNGVVEAGSISLVNFLAGLTNEAIVQGNGTIQSPTVINNGILAPGDSVDASGDSSDLLTLQTASATLTPTSQTEIEIFNTCEFDQLVVTGDLVLGGDLQVTLRNGFIPAATDSFTIVTTGTHSGTFANTGTGNIETTDGFGNFDVSFENEMVVLSNFEFTGDFLPGDVNGDGVVNLLDIGPFVDAISNGTFIPAADINMDGVVNLLDVGPFVAILSGG